MFRLADVGFGEVLGVGVLTVGCQDQARKGGAPEYIAHDEGQVSAEPKEGGPPRSTDGMRVEVPSIDLEIQPIEGKGLGQAQDGLAEEGVDTHGRPVLEQERDDGVAKDQRDKGIRPLGLVLDVGGRDKVEILGHARGDGARFDLPVQIVLHQHDGDTAEQV